MTLLLVISKALMDNPALVFTSCSVCHVQVVVETDQSGEEALHFLTMMVGA